MSLVCIIIGAVFYLALEGINLVRLQYYRTSLISEPVKFFSEILLEQPEATREAWLAVTSQWLNTEIKLVTADELSLSDRERSNLAQGKVIIYLPDRDPFDLGRSIVALPEQGEVKYLVSKGVYFSEELGRGMVLLVANYLANFPVADWDGKIAELNARFKFPITREPPFAVDLVGDKKTGLYEEGKAVAQFTGSHGSQVQVSAFKLLEPTGEILRLGPQPVFNWYPRELLSAMAVMAFALVGLAVYLLVKPLETRLSHLEKAVLRIRGGDLNARAPVEGSDAIGQLAGTLNGMTEHIQRLLNSQKELTRAVSHELRTPVARIRFGLEMLVDAENDEQRLRNVDLIDQDIEQLDKLIDEILTYSKLEEGTPVLDFVMIDLDELMRRIEHESQALAKDKQVVYIAPDLPKERCFAEGEERYIHRVAQNLVGNALRYAQNRVEITFSAMGDVFRIDVHDDGPGIPESDRKRVFQPFTRLDDSRTRASGGYGLGLSIVNRIAYWHGGRVRVGESELGGAKFSFLWPRLQSLRESS